ncbi:hypothetical protein DFH09DRAFT_1389882 [Mycena vulgaris]|nr:hypothetical protein DFH09DRAFT_1389882 [Mycena vulgaris]
MASVASLHARIDELSLAITRQKEILQDLEQRKSDIQSDLNSILDPLARVPLELSSDIFLRCLPDKPFPHATPAPLLFLNVCRSWSKIAISTPRLWAAIRAEYPGLDFAKSMDRWACRAGSLPLSITLCGRLNLDLCDSVRQNAYRVQTLELHLLSGNELGKITTAFPSLKALIIARDDEDVRAAGSYSLDGRECIDILRGAPYLLDCTLRELHNGSSVVGGKPDRLTHSNLKHLQVTGSSALMLRSLTLPALESLDIPASTIPRDEFLAFLTRSSFPLKSLKIEIPGGNDWSHSIVERVFLLLPSLTDLDLSTSLSNPVFLEVLAVSSPTQFIPNLRNLTIHTAYPPTRPQYEQLIKSLSARRACGQSPMQTFRLLWWSLDKADPDADIIVAFQKLVADGMEVHMGTKRNNGV